VGAGVVGLAVACEAVRAGHEVRCFEAAAPMGARSAGGTRIFRLAHAAPGLVEWAVRARRGWHRWSHEAGVELVGGEGTVVSGEIAEIAAAMTQAGAGYRVVEEPPPLLPADAPGGPFLVDPAGGVIQAAAAGRFLVGVLGSRLVSAEVTAVEVRGGSVCVLAGADGWECGSVLLAAGAATPELAAQVGIRVPAAMEHHARFTYALRDPAAAPPCWLDDSQAWQPGFTGYGHLAGPGLWAAGLHLPGLQVGWDVGREQAVQASAETVGRYVTEYLTGLLPGAVETVYCTTIAGAGDGVSAERAGSVLAVWGNNLFKHAPYLAEVLVTALASGELPTTLEAAAPR